MTTLVEKVQYILSGLIILLVLTRYVFLGPADTRSPDLLEPVEAISNSPGGPRGSTPAAGDAAEKAENREIRAKIMRDVGVAIRKPLRRERYKVPEDTLDYVSEKRNWVYELKKAASTVIRGRGRYNMLEIHDIEEDSLLRKFGFQDGDKLVLIDKELQDFDPSRQQDYLNTASRVLDDLNAGKKISVTVLRNGEPVHLEFQLRD